MNPSRFTARAALAGWLLSGAGCSPALKADSDQCTADADCAARGLAGTVCVSSVCVTPPDAGSDAGPDPKWGCIGTGIPLPSGSKTAFKMRLADLITGNPIKGNQNLTIKLCSKHDAPCASPLMSLSPDATGTVGATVASSFEGYLDISDSSGSYIPALVFIDLAVIAQNAQTLLIPKSAVMTLAMNAMVAVDPTASLLMVDTVDCTGARSAGVSVGMTPAGTEAGFYLINNTLETTATMTDSAGNAGFINVKAPQTVTVTGTVAATKAVMGQVTPLVRSGGVTYLIVRPTPNP